MKKTHTLIASLIVLTLGYSPCTGGILALPHALALPQEEDPLMSVAPEDQFTCFPPVFASIDWQDQDGRYSGKEESPCSGKRCATVTPSAAFPHAPQTICSAPAFAQGFPPILHASLLERLNPIMDSVARASPPPLLTLCTENIRLLE